MNDPLYNYHRSPQRFYVLHKEISSPPIPLRTDAFAPNLSHRNWQTFKPGEAEERDVEWREAERQDVDKNGDEWNGVKHYCKMLTIEFHNNIQSV